jgi:hypothetical protein
MRDQRKAGSEFCAIILLLFAAYIIAGSTGGHIFGESSGRAELHDVGENPHRAVVHAGRALPCWFSLSIFCVGLVGDRMRCMVCLVIKVEGNLHTVAEPLIHICVCAEVACSRSQLRLSQ